jgi:hypothetical protein
MKLIYSLNQINHIWHDSQLVLTGLDGKRVQVSSSHPELQFFEPARILFGQSDGRWYVTLLGEFKVPTGSSFPHAARWGEWTAVPNSHSIQQVRVALDLEAVKHLRPSESGHSDYDLMVPLTAQVSLDSDTPI